MTRQAVEGARKIDLKGGIITNPQIVQKLTKDGSLVIEWKKFKTESVKLSSGESKQVHFYKNTKTGKVDHKTYDYKVKGEVNP